MKSGYPQNKTKFLVDGFSQGFDLHYEGDRNCTRTSPNLRFRVGDPTDLWNKLMKEVQVGRVAGPYEQPPFKNFIQSPIGLVPKDKGQKTRLIFHLSYPKGSNLSVNANTPKKYCTVKYMDFDAAVQLCIIAGKGCKAAKSDLTAAFRQLGLRPQDWMLLVMKAVDPQSNKTYYFVDKCLPFGHTISCALFQKVSDALAHLVKHRCGRWNINYLDDFFFVAMVRALCNEQVMAFTDICQTIGMPVSPEKTFWGTTKIVFLGLLINTVTQTVCIPTEKVQVIEQFLITLLTRRSKKLTLLELQQVCGHLNFICRCVIPGRAYTRRLYHATARAKKPHHRIRIDPLMRADLEMWLKFIQHPTVFCRPFLDFKDTVFADEICMYSDASRNHKLGAGGYCGTSWFILKWDEYFMQQHEPSIAYLELYAVAICILNWIQRFANRRVILFCDNMSVVYMLNKNTSHCPKCLILIRMIVLHSMIHNVRVFAKHVASKDNLISDLLSRNKYQQFLEVTEGRFESQPTPIPNSLWPMNKLWLNCRQQAQKAQRSF